MAEQMSCRNPGRVSSLDLVPPPMVWAASRTRTRRPLRARATAAASPFGPDPTTTASYDPLLMRRSVKVRAFVGWDVAVSRGHSPRYLIHYPHLPGAAPCAL